MKNNGITEYFEEVEITKNITDIIIVYQKQ